MRLSYHIKLFKKGKVVGYYTIQRRTVLFARIVRGFLSKSIDKVYVKVIYGSKGINEGYYETAKEFRRAWKAFTEKPLIDYIFG